MTLNTRKIALVTGGAKRIGESLVKHLGSTGWNVVIHCNNSSKEASILAKKHKYIIGIEQCDFSIVDNLIGFLPNIIQKYGNISLLINSASSFENDSLDEIDISKWQNNFNINLLAASILIGDFAKQKIFTTEVTGNIINITDQAIFSSSDIFTSYLLSKVSLTSLTKIAAAKYAPIIRVNAIAPGITIKGVNQSDDHFNQMCNNTLLKKAASLDDICTTIDFLIQNSSITGQIIKIDSGQVKDTLYDRD